MATFAHELSATPRQDAKDASFIPFSVESVEGVKHKASSTESEVKDDGSEYFTPDGMLNPTSDPLDDTMKEAQAQVPIHPISSMQGAFAESMIEASRADENDPSVKARGTASERRKILLDQDKTEPTHAARWQLKPGVRYHELWKLMAQISFGIYLLLNGIAKDDEQVMTILQGHVDEVDEFLESTLADFDLAQQDIDERLKFLKLPLENISIFDAMLEDRSFRLQIVNGNERIEHAITRTADAMTDALRDVKHGMQACREFKIYLAEEHDDPIWKGERPDMQKVHDAMKGNVEGWHKAYVSLQTKGNHLGVALVQLGSIVAEMDRRAGEVSRRRRFSTAQASTGSAPSPASPRQSRQMRKSMLKNLPEDPSQITPAIRATLPAFQMVQDRERSPQPEPTSEHSSLVELDASGPDFILKPHTYTPVPSPRVSAPLPIEAPEPEVTKKPSLRNRFSLKRKEAPAPTHSTPRENPDSYWGPRQRIHSISGGPNWKEDIATTPQSRGLDSAYCSDFEKGNSPSHKLQPTNTLEPTRSHPSYRESAQTQPLPQREFSSHHHSAIPSPRSEKQFFRPVNASPNSPLQRPWTAAEMPREKSHIHSNSSTSNLSTLRGQQHLSTTHTNGSSHNLHHSSTLPHNNTRRGAPSAMGMSMMSGTTTLSELNEKQKNEKKLKKKRSAFGWLKKAFSLSEEEKRAFEEKRMMKDDYVVKDGYRGGYYQRPEQRWVDGKKVTNGGGGGMRSSATSHGSRNGASMRGTSAGGANTPRI